MNGGGEMKTVKQEQRSHVGGYVHGDGRLGHKNLALGMSSTTKSPAGEP